MEMAKKQKGLFSCRRAFPALAGGRGGATTQYSVSRQKPRTHSDLTSPPKDSFTTHTVTAVAKEMLLLLDFPAETFRSQTWLSRYELNYLGVTVKDKFHSQCSSKSGRGGGISPAPTLRESLQP